MSARILPNTLPANAWSIDSGVAALIIEPWTRDLSHAEKRAICGAKRVRIFVDNRAEASLSRPVPEPIKFEHYPLGTLRWCVALATSILPSVFDCRKSTRSEDLEALLQKFDTPDNVEEFCVLHVLADNPSDVENFRSRHRDYVPFRAATARSAAPASHRGKKERRR
jgi:hypothetical protein